MRSRLLLTTGALLVGLVSSSGVSAAGPATLKSVSTNSAGQYSYTYTVSVIRDYRVVFPSTPVIWGSTSKLAQR